MGAEDPGRLVVRVISLASARSRREGIRANLARLGATPWSFFDALTGDSPVGPSPDEAEQRVRFGRKLSPGEVGCFKSHVAVIEEFCRSSAGQWLLVLEDDVFLDVNFDLAGLTNILETMGIGYLRLYSRRLKPFTVLRYFEERQLVRFKSDPYGTQAYLIDKVAGKRFLASLRSISMPIDDEMGRFWHNGLELFALFPYPVLEQSGSSSIAMQRMAQETGRRRSSVPAIRFRVVEKTQKVLANLRFEWAKRR